MHNLTRAGILGLLIAVVLSAPAAAQPSFDTTYQTIDFSGEWSELAFEGSFQYDLGDYSGVPLNALCSVNRVRSVSLPAVALAIPKSITRL